MTTLHLRTLIGRPGNLPLVALLFSCVLLSPEVKAQCTGCFTTNCNTFPISEEPSAWCAGCDGLGFHYNTAYGCSSLIHATVTSCDDNSCGPDGGHYTGADMSFNTAVGSHALYQNAAGGNNNSAIGAYSLYSNTSGTFNTAGGYKALYGNTTGNGNTANGVDALLSNNIGSYNTANGTEALRSNTTGTQNTANGSGALNRNVTGNYNTANGNNALVYNTGGKYNTANGVSALYYNTGGNYNTAEGSNALFHDTGSNNIGLGSSAGSNLTTGSGNVCIGQGVLGVSGESNTTRIRNVYSSVASGRVVYVNSDNKIGTLVSSRRFKDEIKSMDKASEAILALKPVTFRYKKEIEPNGAIMFGLIAEEVEKADPNLVTRSEKGEAEAVRYDAVNAMLLNEFLKEHRTVENLKSTAAKQEATIAQQQKGMEVLAATLKEQASQIQKVSALLELNKSAPQMAGNDR